MKPKNEKDARRIAARRIGAHARVSYSAALALLATLAALSFYFSNQAIRDFNVSSDTLNLAKAQNISVQSTALAAVRYAAIDDPEEKAQLLRFLSEKRNALFANHINLIGQSAQNNMTARDEIQALLFEEPHRVDFQLRRLVNLVDIVVAAPHERLNDDLIFQITRMATLDLPENLTRIEEIYSANAVASLRWLSLSGIWLFLATLVVLAGTGMFIFRPIVSRAVTQTLTLLDTEDALEFTAQHDALTGLPNRLGIKALYERRKRVRRDLKMTAIKLDLVNFSNVNETLGHQVGDEVLRMAAERLRSAVRSTDYVARVGGDDFAVVIPSHLSAEDIDDLCVRIRDELTQPIELGAQQVKVGVALGVAQEQEDEPNYEQLITSAGIALNEAKAKPSEEATLYAPSMRTNLHERDRLLRDLETGIENDEIQPYFQPQINASDGAVLGFEALIRWVHPKRGLMPPFQFLPIAEEAGLGMTLGERVLNRSLEAVQRWDVAGFHVPQVGVNFSAEQLTHQTLVEAIKTAVSAADLAPDRLAIEVLEAVMLDHSGDDIVTNIVALKDAGFHIELDDFGTGHASLSNLRRFHVDRVKIDRSFVSGIDADENLRKMTQALVRMAQGLGIDTLAEGVETPGEREALANMGIDALQGYGIGRPMPFAETIGWLTENELFLHSRARRKRG
ncbi:MAG: bifunctional diguanylate cyclase/phosphodiesterase [Pseudomonadota bacterium]